MIACNVYYAGFSLIIKTAINYGQNTFPLYNDPNDEIALQKLQTLYPNRTVVGIDCRNVYANGGMIHCITQQQPEE